VPEQGLDDLAADPDWFLHRVDAVEGRALFVRSDRDRLASTLFLDGRTSFGSGETRSVELAALEELAGATAVPAKLILHMSFCGSTQLAHLVGESGAGIVLKEPQALVDLADWQRTLTERKIADRRFGPALRASIALLSRSWPASPPTIIKPSNWANNLIPILDAAGSRAVLVTIERRAFLRAVFRGGRDRLAFTARAASHFAAAAGQTARIDRAIGGVDDAFDQMARLVLVAHDLQQQYLADSDRFAATARIDQKLIGSDPRAALYRASSTLALSCSPDRANVIHRLSSLDSKNPGRPFTANGQAAEDDVVEHHHGQRFDRALAWADQHPD